MYEKIEFYPDRTFGRNCHYCHPGGDAFARFIRRPQFC